MLQTANKTAIAIIFLIMTKTKKHKNLGFKCKNNSCIAEHHHGQWQKVAEDDREKSDGFHHGVALVDAERQTHTGAVHDIRSHGGHRNLNCWKDDPHKCDCSIRVMLLGAQLQNAEH